jgi:hypothetical protein
MSGFWANAFRYGAACTLVAGSLAGSVLAQDLDSPEAVARLELVVPANPRVLLHATFPVPKGTYPLADRSTPFAVLNHDPAATLVPAQVEIVSRYPTGEADVVEIFAPVDFAPEDKPGAYTSFRIVPSTSKQAKAPPVPKAVQALLARHSRGDFGVRARDVHGNLYFADLSGDPTDPGFGSMQILKTGPYVREHRVYATMVPIGEPSTSGPPLPHLLGVHAYITERAGQNEVEVDLRVNNGATPGNRVPGALEAPLDEPLGIVYWRTIQLVLPAGFTAVAEVPDPFLGKPKDEGGKAKKVVVIPIVLPFVDGRMHMMGPGAQFERRFLVMPAAPAKPAAPAGKLAAATPQAPGGAGASTKKSGKAPGPAAPTPGATGAGARPMSDPSLFDAGLAFSANGKNLWSWFDPETARYFPQRDLLASFDLVNANGMTGRKLLRARFARELADLREGLSAGIAKGANVLSPAMGWAHPWFLREAGGPGGEGISTCEGYYAVATASRDPLDALSLIHRMNVCRQPIAAYDRFGNAVGYQSWLDAQGRIPFDVHLDGGPALPCFRLPCEKGTPASEQVRAVVQGGGRPPYDLGDPFEPDGAVPDRDDCLLAWKPHDDEHYVRYTKQAKALVWLANDAMAKDDLILAAELFHLSRQETPRAEDAPPRTLENLERAAREHPHQGLAVGREDAWGIDAMCAAYSVADPEWRKRNQPWFDRIASLLVAGAMPSGLVQRSVDDQWFGNARYAATQTFESLLLVHAMRCMNESVFRSVDDAKREALERVAVQGVDYLFFGPAWGRVANNWQPSPANPTLYLQGPRQAVAVALNDDYKTPPFCAQQPNFLPTDALSLGVEWYHPWAALSYAQEITDAWNASSSAAPKPKPSDAVYEGKPREEWRDLVAPASPMKPTGGAGLANRFLRRAVECGKTHKNLRELILDFLGQATDATYDNSANWVGLLGKIQSLQRR